MHIITDKNYHYEEPCPECGAPVPVRIDPHDASFEIVCPECGAKMMLCTHCHDCFGDCDYTRCEKLKALQGAYTYETYPPMFTGYDAGIENENYDHELRVFAVPADWAIKWMRDEVGMTKEEFDAEYDWDGTCAMHEAATLAGVVLMEWIEERDW